MKSVPAPSEAPRWDCRRQRRRVSLIGGSGKPAESFTHRKGEASGDEVEAETDPLKMRVGGLKYHKVQTLEVLSARGPKNPKRQEV